MKLVAGNTNRIAHSSLWLYVFVYKQNIYVHYKALEIIVTKIPEKCYQATNRHPEKGRNNSRFTPFPSLQEHQSHGKDAVLKPTLTALGKAEPEVRSLVYPGFPAQLFLMFGTASRFQQLLVLASVGCWYTGKEVLV